MSIFKKKSKIAAALMAAAVVMTSMAIPAAADTAAVDGEMDDITGLVYKATEDGSGWIVSCLQTNENNPVTGDVVIPEKWTNEAGEEKTVIKVAYALFVYPKNIISLSIPKTVTEIVGRYIGGNPGLQSITVDADNANFTAVDGVLYNKDKTELIKYPMQKTAEEYVIPDGVTKISIGAFSWTYPAVPKLKKITFPVSITETHVSVLNSFGAIVADTGDGPKYGGAAIEYKGTREQWKAITFDTADSNLPTGLSPYHNIKCSDGTIFDFSALPETGEKDTAGKVSEGIKVEAPEGAFSTDVTLKREGAALTAARFDVDISFVDAGGNKVQPTKPVTVKIPVPESMQSASEIFVYHTDDNGKMTKVEATAETVDSKKYVVFTASSFSVYTLSSTAIAEAENPGNNNSGYTVVVPDNTASTSAPQTAASETTSQSAAETTASAAAGSADGSDKNQATGVAIAVIPAVLAAAAVIISKKRK